MCVHIFTSLEAPSDPLWLCGDVFGGRDHGGVVVPSALLPALLWSASCTKVEGRGCGL